MSDKCIRIYELLKNIIPSNCSDITVNTKLFEEKILDSFSIIQLINSIEVEFDVSISTNEMVVQNFETIEQISLLVNRLDSSDSV